MEEENQSLSAPKKAETKKPYGEFFYWLQTLVSAIVCIVLVFTFVGRVTRVVGHSMDPTLSEGELLFVWSLGYEPKQGDIIVCNKTTATFLGGDAIVKRVIAVGGQTVDVDYATSTVYVDGEPLDEPYVLEPSGWFIQPGMEETHVEVPEGSVFLMGDNRNGSTDSRHCELGPVDTDYILGKAVFSLFPFNKMGPM